MINVRDVWPVFWVCKGLLGVPIVEIVKSLIIDLDYQL